MSKSLFNPIRTDHGTRWEAPTQASESSRAGAECARHMVGRQCMEILRAIGVHGPMARFELLLRIDGLSEKAACGRIGEMKNPDRHRPAILQREPLLAVTGKARAPSGVNVDVYDLTEAGRKLIGD